MHPLSEYEMEKAGIEAYESELKDRTLSGGELLKEAMKQSEAGNTEKEIVSLYLYLDEIDAAGPRLILIYQDVRFKLATLLMEEKRIDEAFRILTEYLNMPMVEREDEARSLLAQCNELLKK